jgi:pyridoxal phosphate enzyme (YggS family)
VDDPLRLPEASRLCLAANLARVRERIARAARAAGRSVQDVQLVAVTKGVGPEAVAEILRMGLLDLGENRPEEVAPKLARLGDEVPAPRFHMIGHYQSRKVRPTLASFARVHSAHARPLLDLMDRTRQEAGGPVLPVLLQVNVTGEWTKQGFAPEEVAGVLAERSRWPALLLDGLMTMAPAGGSRESARQAFAALRVLAARLEAMAGPLPHLSMGMSQDLEEAVAEGATFVRVGTALFSEPGAGDEAPVAGS